MQLVTPIMEKIEIQEGTVTTNIEIGVNQNQGTLNPMIGP